MQLASHVTARVQVTVEAVPLAMRRRRVVCVKVKRSIVYFFVNCCLVFGCIFCHEILGIITSINFPS